MMSRSVPLAITARPSSLGDSTCRARERGCIQRLQTDRRGSLLLHALG